MSIETASQASSSSRDGGEAAVSTAPEARPPRSRPGNIFLFLLAVRLLNALTIQTFFQPDEYFQALEPAWRFAFGDGSGAWITWEWKNHLRSAIHPVLFGVCYRAADVVAEALALDPAGRSELLLVAPKVLQAVFAAVTDVYTWHLASYIYGDGTPASYAASALTVVSPWQWFCSTRTFSNSLETCLTVVALYNWPWHWAVSDDGKKPRVDAQNLRIREGVGLDGRVDQVTHLRRTLLCAALATVLRPTNVLVWMVLTLLTFVPTRVISKRPSTSWVELAVFVREAVVCGSVVLGMSAIVDRVFYEAWVFPPWNFLEVNVVQSLATFYGNNDWHYYLSQGYPLLLTTALPFGVVGLFWAFTGRDTPGVSPEGRSALYALGVVSLVVPTAFSNISHKEVRFIYPLLPALHVVTARPAASFFGYPKLRRKWLIGVLLGLNVAVAYYTTRVHNSGTVQLVHHLRHEFEEAYAPTDANMTVGMLMPCHSTPWRSHLQYPPLSAPGIRAWALTCEPPLHLDASQKLTYLDEADQFYADPSAWLKRHMSRTAPTRRDSRATGSAARGRPTDALDKERDEIFWATGAGRRPWPDYLVFFEQLEPTLRAVLKGSNYVQCRRLFNSHWHDDGRRRGDVVVWCLDGTRRDRNLSPPAEEALRNPAPAPEDQGSTSGQKILGRGQLPAAAKPQKKEPPRRVVDKPFWKVREPEDE